MSTYLGNSKVSPTISGDTEIKYAFTDDGSVGGDVSNVKSVSVNGAPLGDGQTRFYVEVGDGETVTLQIGRDGSGSSRILIIDWGDGNIEEYTVANAAANFPYFNTSLAKTHTYTTAGKYAIVPMDTKASIGNRFRFGINGTNATTGLNNQIVAAEIGFNNNGDATLGISGFQYCGNLKKVYFNDGITTIPSGCFVYNRSNSTINWLDSITTVGANAFNTGNASCSINLTNFSCKNLISVGSSAFMNSLITEAIFEQSDCTIGNYAFRGCKQLKKIYFPRNITTIPDYVCYECDGGLEIDMPDTVTTINSSAFYKCKDASIKKMPNSLQIIDSNAFSNGISPSSYSPSQRYFNFNGLTTLPDTITTINSYAFCSAANLCLTKLPDSLTTMGQYAFANTDVAITSIPSGVTVIPVYCFGYCYSQTNVTLHANITTINHHAFYGRPSLTITMLATTPPTVDNTAFTRNSGLKIYVPAASLNAYKTATNWSLFASYMEAIPT